MNTFFKCPQCGWEKEISKEVEFRIGLYATTY